MAKEFAVLLFLVNLLTLNCQEDDIAQVVEQDESNNGKPSYSFSYGVSDVHTGDIKTAWERKEGDTVKGHYSVLQPDGTVRSVEYSAGPNTGFTAVVNSENSIPSDQSNERIAAEPKAMRGFEQFYDISEDFEEDDDPYKRKWNKRPFDSYKERRNSHRKRPKYPFDLEPSEYTHSITIKHPHDDSSESEEAYSHVGYSSDPNCKTKTKLESYENQDNLYSNIVDFELNQPHKYPIFPPEPFKDYDKYTGAASSNYDLKKNRPYKYSKYDELGSSPSMKQNYPTVPDVPPSDKYYPEDIPPPRPKKKTRPPKLPEYLSDDLDDYILVPKKKYKPMRGINANDYRLDSDEEYDHPPYSSSYDDHEDKFRPVRENVANKEVIRKIVTKRRPPIVKLFDIFDI